MRLAQSEKETTEALLEDYFRNLRADATIAYLEALKQKALLEIQRSSYDQMARLARADSIRFQLGDITEVDALQSPAPAFKGIMAGVSIPLKFSNTLWSSWSAPAGYGILKGINFFSEQNEIQTVYSVKESNYILT